VSRRITPSILALTIAVAILAAACGAIPNPLATATPPDALHPNPPVAAVATAIPTPDPTKLDEVARQRAIWAQQGIHTYRLTLLFGCECGLGGGQPVEVTVVDDAVTGATVGGKALSGDQRTGYPMSIDELFDYADRNAGAGKLELKYDEHLGYPVALGVDPDLNARDDEIRVAVAKLVPGR
jgi:Family of unknown function (DUF6174)